MNERRIERAEARDETRLAEAAVPLPRFPLHEEIAHAVTHGVGIVLAITGLVVLVALAFRHGDTLRVATCAVYGTTLILLYVASTLYHSIPHERAKRVLRVLDHCAIYLLIAGTYTPITLVNLRGPWGWGLFGFVWSLAVAGIVFKIVATGKLRVLSVLVYLLLGWCIVVAFEPLRQVVPERGIELLVAGGVAYTLGTIFFGLKKLPYHHAIWHLFVLGGSVLHFFAILTSVIPSR